MIPPGTKLVDSKEAPRRFGPRRRRHHARRQGRSIHRMGALAQAPALQRWTFWHVKPEGSA